MQESLNKRNDRIYIYHVFSYKKFEFICEFLEKLSEDIKFIEIIEYKDPALMRYLGFQVEKFPVIFAKSYDPIANTNTKVKFDMLPTTKNLVNFAKSIFNKSKHTNIKINSKLVIYKKSEFYKEEKEEINKTLRLFENFILSIKSVSFQIEMINLKGDDYQNMLTISTKGKKDKTIQMIDLVDDNEDLFSSLKR